MMLWIEMWQAVQAGGTSTTSQVNVHECALEELVNWCRQIPVDPTKHMQKILLQAQNSCVEMDFLHSLMWFVLWINGLLRSNNLFSKRL